jgi:hypothetical protein
MGNTPFCVGIEDGKPYLLIARIEIYEKVIYFVDDLFDSGVATVYLIDDDYNGQFFGKGLFHDEPGLWQRPLAGIDQQNGSIDHIQTAFDLTAEISMAGSINDVDLNVAVPNGRILCHDGDAPFPFEIHGVHNPLRYFLMLAECPRLLEHGINKGSFAVIDMGNNGNISYILFSHVVWISFKKASPLSALVGHPYGSGQGGASIVILIFFSRSIR